MVPLDVDTNVSGAAIIAAITHTLYRRKKGMLGTALIDALPTILMDTSTYDLTDFDPHAKVRENQFLLMSVSFSHLLGAALRFVVCPPQCF